jgi:hypothetical protein
MIERYRGIISNAIVADNGSVHAKLVSDDLLSHEQGRNPLTTGGTIRTSQLQSIDVVEGQLVINTRNSSYIVEGTLMTVAGIINSTPIEEG